MITKEDTSWNKTRKKKYFVKKSFKVKIKIYKRENSRYWRQDKGYIAQSKKILKLKNNLGPKQPVNLEYYEKTSSIYNRTRRRKRIPGHRHILCFSF